ncbi:LysR family transcriptional regulator [Roseomonas sp. SSH11]|uniref:LysR family transcriptional regulator n=1 Tax=Pararoseomonas baculiformis TaxID=2820812 RepID=A0ABS4AIU1_9PROT|nr:LysR family transcriptional regulator [Pararoseomonas baculiformis]MBP0446946.1 LysR family transcriptional regulator [Pararoseomonas baculiformis]
MDIRQLRSFIEVAETGSLSRASDRLRLVQPALSRHIRMLEEQVGAPLFTRHGRGMRLTDAGQALLDRVAGPLRQIERSLEEVRGLLGKVAGHVALGLMPTTSHVLSGRIVRRVAAELPEVSLRVVEGYAGHLVEWLRRGELDATLLYGPAGGLNLPVETLLHDDLALIGPAGALDGGASVAMRDLASLEMVLPSRPHGLRHLIESAAAEAAVSLRIRFEADSFRVLKDIVATGLGYTVLPPSSIAPDEMGHRFSMAPLRDPTPCREILLARPPDRGDSRAAQAVMALLRDEARNLVLRGGWPGAALPG